MTEIAKITIVSEGPGALLIDAATERFCEASQTKILFVSKQLHDVAGVMETVPGMNNLMVTFDPFMADLASLQETIARLWRDAPEHEAPSRTIEIEVRYGGAEGPDLAAVAASKGLSAEDLVKRHTAALYRVAAVGAMPGFVYLSGLDETLSIPRLATPRTNVPEGSVIIGGAQAGIMPVTAPSGWHILGRTDFKLFDPLRERPAFFQPGDCIRFVARSVT